MFYASVEIAHVFLVAPGQPVLGLLDVEATFDITVVHSTAVHRVLKELLVSHGVWCVLLWHVANIGLARVNVLDIHARLVVLRVVIVETVLVMVSLLVLQRQVKRDLNMLE